MSPFIQRLLPICGILALLCASLAKAPTAKAATFVVTTMTDAPHTATIDGSCISTLPDHAGTLRSAIQAASFLGGYLLTCLVREWGAREEGLPAPRARRAA